MVFVLLNGVGIELLEHTADCALIRDAEGAPKCGVKANIAVGVVEVRDRGADEIAKKVGIGRLPLAVIAAGANRG